MTILERDKENFEDSIRTEAISIRFVIGGTIARLVLLPKNDFQKKLSNIFQKNRRRYSVKKRKFYTFFLFKFPMRFFLICV